MNGNGCRPLTTGYPRYNAALQSQLNKSTKRQDASSLSGSDGMGTGHRESEAPGQPVDSGSYCYRCTTVSEKTPRKWTRRHYADRRRKLMIGITGKRMQPHAVKSAQNNGGITKHTTAADGFSTGKAGNESEPRQ